MIHREPQRGHNVSRPVLHNPLSCYCSMMQHVQNGSVILLLTWCQWSTDGRLTLYLSRVHMPRAVTDNPPRQLDCSRPRNVGVWNAFLPCPDSWRCVDFLLQEPEIKVKYYYFFIFLSVVGKNPNFSTCFIDNSGVFFFFFFNPK